MPTAPLPAAAVAASRAAAPGAAGPTGKSGQAATAGKAGRPKTVAKTAAAPDAAAQDVARASRSDPTRAAADGPTPPGAPASPQTRVKPASRARPDTSAEPITPPQAAAPAPQMIALPPDVNAAMGSLRVILKTVQQSLAQVKQHTGVSGAQLWCLAAVARQPGIRVTQLAHALGVRQATVSKLVDVLVRKRLLLRQRGEHDQRVVMLQLSTAGQQALQRAPVPAAGVLPEALLKLPGEHLQQLAGLLDELRQALGAHPSASRTPLAELLKERPGRRA